MLLYPNSQPTLLSENLHGNTEIKKTNESYMLQKGITCFELRLFIYLLINFVYRIHSILCWGSQAGLILIFTAVGT